MQRPPQTPLGKLLVRARVITTAQLEEAVAWQVLYGGRLGTNLLELSMIDEETLARTLGTQLGCAWAAGELAVDPGLVQLIPASLAVSHEIVPWRIDGKKLSVLCSSPASHVALFDEMSHRLGLFIKPVVIPEHRLQVLLRQHYQPDLPVRLLNLGVPVRHQQEEPPPAPAVANDLMDDAAFTELYAEGAAGRAGGLDGRPPQWSGSSDPPAPRGMPPSPVIATSASEETGEIIEGEPVAAEEIIEGELIEIEEEPAAVFVDSVSAAHWAREMKEVEARLLAEVPPSRPPVDVSPLSFAEAQSAIGSATDRDLVGRTVLRFARTLAARTFLLSIQGDVALGWQGAGDGITEELVRRITLSLKDPGAFRLVRESHSHYVGPLGKDAGNVQFLKMAGKQWPNTAVLLPIIFQGRVVYILYLDNGHRQHVNAEVGELLILSRHITRSMEQLVQERQDQLKGTG